MKEILFYTQIINNAYDQSFDNASYSKSIFDIYDEEHLLEDIECITLLKKFVDTQKTAIISLLDKRLNYKNDHDFLKHLSFFLNSIIDSIKEEILSANKQNNEKIKS